LWQSTIFKQVNSINGTGFTKEQLGRVSKLIKANIMESMQKLVAKADKYKEEEKCDFKL
jgi:hypothetical protein